MYCRYFCVVYLGILGVLHTANLGGHSRLHSRILRLSSASASFGQTLGCELTQILIVPFPNLFLKIDLFYLSALVDAPLWRTNVPRAGVGVGRFRERRPEASLAPIDAVIEFFFAFAYDFRRTARVEVFHV